MKKIFNIFFYAILLLLPLTLYAKDIPRVAVLPFEAGQGVSGPEAQYLTDRIRTGLIDSQTFDVISNDQLQTMMKVTQEKQKIGTGSCTSQKCIIDLGNALECEKMIVGTAAGAFKEFTISIKMLDVVTQKYELAKELVLQSKDEFPAAARKIVGVLVDSFQKKETTLKKDDGSEISGRAKKSGFQNTVGLIAGPGLKTGDSEKYSLGDSMYYSLFFIFKIPFLSTNRFLLQANIDFEKTEFSYVALNETHPLTTVHGIGSLLFFLPLGFLENNNFFMFIAGGYGVNSKYSDKVSGIGTSMEGALGFIFRLPGSLRNLSLRLESKYRRQVFDSETKFFQGLIQAGLQFSF